MIRLLAFSLVLLGARPPQLAGSEALAPELEARVQALGKVLRCAVCQGLSVADSPASMARAQLDKVRELVAAGQSDAEVRAYFVARYGEWVLLEPSREGLTWLVWLLPAALVLVGLLVVFQQTRGKPRATSSDGGVAATKDDDAYLRAVRSEVDR
jgi:cytochrome c-type biogenesis protein CcmH